MKSTQEKHPFHRSQIAQQIQYLEQWQVQHEQLLGFQNRFAHQLDEVLDWAKDVYTRLDEIEEDVAETKETVLKTHGLSTQPPIKPAQSFPSQADGQFSGSEAKALIVIHKSK